MVQRSPKHVRGVGDTFVYLAYYVQLVGTKTSDWLTDWLTAGKHDFENFKK